MSKAYTANPPGFDRSELTSILSALGAGADPKFALSMFGNVQSDVQRRRQQQAQMDLAQQQAAKATRQKQIATILDQVLSSAQGGLGFGGAKAQATGLEGALGLGQQASNTILQRISGMYPQDAQTGQRSNPLFTAASRLASKQLAAKVAEHQAIYGTGAGATAQDRYKLGGSEQVAMIDMLQALSRGYGTGGDYAAAVKAGQVNPVGTAAAGATRGLTPEQVFRRTMGNFTVDASLNSPQQTQALVAGQLQSLFPQLSNQELALVLAGKSAKQIRGLSANSGRGPAPAGGNPVGASSTGPGPSSSGGGMGAFLGGALKGVTGLLGANLIGKTLTRGGMAGSEAAGLSQSMGDARALGQTARLAQGGEATAAGDMLGTLGSGTGLLAGLAGAQVGQTFADTNRVVGFAANALAQGQPPHAVLSALVRQGYDQGTAATLLQAAQRQLMAQHPNFSTAYSAGMGA